MIAYILAVALLIPSISVVNLLLILDLLSNRSLNFYLYLLFPWVCFYYQIDNFI
jgi:hypothetical protein